MIYLAKMRGKPPSGDGDGGKNIGERDREMGENSPENGESHRKNGEKGWQIGETDPENGRHGKNNGGRVKTFFGQGAVQRRDGGQCGFRW